jgi:hypothetical protein
LGNGSQSCAGDDLLAQMFIVFSRPWLVFGVRGHFLALSPEFDQPANGFRLPLPGDKQIERKV